MWDSDRRRRCRRRQLFRDADGSQEALRDYQDVLGLKKKKKKIPLSRRPGEALGRIRSVGQSVKGRGGRSPGDSERLSYLLFFCDDHLSSLWCCGSVACVRPHERVTGGRGQGSKSFCDKVFTCWWLNLIRLSSFTLCSRRLQLNFCFFYFHSEKVMYQFVATSFKK